jgi:AraC-like DNA-binding protein
MTGETPAGYLRQRRLSEAARALVDSSQPILEIALDYQFNSQEAFTRAFHRRFRLTPNAYRHRRRLKRFQPRLHVKRRQLYQLEVTYALIVSRSEHFKP